MLKCLPNRAHKQGGYDCYHGRHPQREKRSQLDGNRPQRTLNPVAGIGSFVTTVATGVETLIPDATVQLVCQLATLIVGAAATAYAVYQTTNAPVD